MRENEEELIILLSIKDMESQISKKSTGIMINPG